MSYLNNALKGKRVLVTGATGFIGGRLAQRLAVEEGATVTGTGRRLDNVPFLKEAGVTLLPADLQDEAALHTAVAGQEIVFHAAAWVDGGRMCGKKPRRLPLWMASLLAGVNGLFHLGLPLNQQRLKFLTSHAVYPTDKAQMRLGYRPRVSLDEGMAAESWLRTQGYLQG